VVALVDDEATIKRIFKQRDFIRLEPANPKMEPIVIKKGEKKVSIVGKVVGIFRKSNNLRGRLPILNDFQIPWKLEFKIYGSSHSSHRYGCFFYFCGTEG
jgi:hypothetical protein